MQKFDIVIISDFRLPGGTNHSTAQELAVHRQLGLRTGLIQANSRLAQRALPWSTAITDELRPGLIEPLRPGEQVFANLVLLRHPVAVEAMPDLSKRVRTDRAIIIANQPAIRPSGAPEYDVVKIAETVQARLGVDPVWAPIGPIVRDSFKDVPTVKLSDTDWTNIFATGQAPKPRTEFFAERPRIGRHSRPQPAKWPATADEILQAYPDSAEYDVRILGGARPALELLSKQPENWTIHSFGELPPLEFLEDVDFWVYFHHHDWLEAYGRAIMEALWSGAVVILPEYLRATYGDAAVYGMPQDVRTIIEDFRSGARDYVLQSATGQMFARAHAPEVHEARLRALLPPAGVSNTVPSAGNLHSPSYRQPQQLSTSRTRAINRYGSSHRPRALFITSNGAGMGHLTRMLGIARAAASRVEPIFFSMSQGLNVVGTAGFPYEYVPFNSALQTKSALWHRYVADRILAAIDHYDAQIVIFDGTWPYRGMLEALDKRDVLRVWIRRGMWKSTISPEQLKQAPRFNLIIEPGEHAHSYDEGATSMVRNAHVVAPMTVLNQSELLSRAQARAALGLSSDPSRKYALVTLGAGNINDLASTQSAVLAAIYKHPSWDPILTKAPISSTASNTELTLSTFPLATYTKAFDFAVSAAGYNSFAEWMTGGLPTVWLPNISTMTDDQDARARWAADNGYGLRASETDPRAIQDAIDSMCVDDVREAILTRLSTLTGENGAEEAATLLIEAWDAYQRRRGLDE